MRNPRGQSNHDAFLGQSLRDIQDVRLFCRMSLLLVDHDCRRRGQESRDSMFPVPANHGNLMKVRIGASRSRQHTPHTG
eukprot:365438-Chlamydomonas_euryale.AAC.13